MTTMGLSKYHEPDWDTKLDNMLADLETGGNSNFQQSNFSFQQQQYFSSSMSNQQQMSGGNIQQQQQQMAFSSSSRSNQGMAPKTNGASFLQKSASSVSLKDSAGEVLKDLENGLVKSSHFIKESHGKVVGPEGTQEWHNVERGGEPNNSHDYDLEMQVQHMMPNLVGYNQGPQQYQQQGYQQRQQQSYQQQQHSYQQQQQSYQHQEQQRSYQQQHHQQQHVQPSIAVEDVDDRPGSRLKQNIDELDNLLYDLNHARNMSPEGGTEYTDTNLQGGLDSDDYSESVGKEGHVKRTVHAFNEYSAQMSSGEVVKKPPSPSPRRKAPHSPSPSRKQQSTTMTYMSNQQQTSTSSSYRSQDMVPQHRYPPETRGYSPPPPSLGYKPSGGQFEPPEPESYPRGGQEAPQPNYYTKFSSVKQSTTTSGSTDREGQGYKFPSSARSPTPQNMPKQVDELMSEFQEFDSTVSKSVSPKPMFSKPTPIVQVTGPPPEPEPSLKLPGPAPMVVDPTPPQPTVPTPSAAPKGPSVYYPPGHEFSKKNQQQTVVIPGPGDGAEAGAAAVAVSEGGSKGAMASVRMESRKERYAREEKEAQEGAAMIPICLPLCCAAPCVIM